MPSGSSWGIFTWFHTFIRSVSVEGTKSSKLFRTQSTTAALVRDGDTDAQVLLPNPLLLCKPLKNIKYDGILRFCTNIATAREEEPISDATVFIHTKKKVVAPPTSGGATHLIEQTLNVE